MRVADDDTVQAAHAPVLTGARPPYGRHPGAGLRPGPGRTGRDQERWERARSKRWNPLRGLARSWGHFVRRPRATQVRTLVRSAPFWPPRWPG